MLSKIKTKIMNTMVKSLVTMDLFCLSLLLVSMWVLVVLGDVVVAVDDGLDAE